MRRACAGRSRGAGAPRRGPAARRAGGAGPQLGEQGARACSSASRGLATRSAARKSKLLLHGTCAPAAAPPELAQAEQPARVRTHSQPGRCAASTPEGSVRPRRTRWKRCRELRASAATSGSAALPRAARRAQGGAGRRGRARAARAGGARAPLPQRRRQPRGEDLEEAQLVKLGVQVEQNHVLCTAQAQCQGRRRTRERRRGRGARACRGGAPS